MVKWSSIHQLEFIFLILPYLVLSYCLTCILSFLIVFYLISLSLYLSISLSLSIYLIIYLSIYLSIHPSIHPSIYLSIYLSTVSIYLSSSIYLALSIWIYLNLSESIWIYLNPSIHPSIHPSIYLSMYIYIYKQSFLSHKKGADWGFSIFVALPILWPSSTGAYWERTFVWRWSEGPGTGSGHPGLTVGGSFRKTITRALRHL